VGAPFPRACVMEEASASERALEDDEAEAALLHVLRERRRCRLRGQVTSDCDTLWKPDQSMQQERRSGHGAYRSSEVHSQQLQQACTFCSAHTDVAACGK
jgi:hypothetical protein